MKVTSRRPPDCFQGEEAMNVWRKLLTAVRGGAHEVGEAVVDSQALRILDQEIRDADDELHRSREALAGIMARQKLAAERVAKLQDQITEYEGYALKALDGEERNKTDGYGNSMDQKRKAIIKAEGNIKRLKQQVDTVKATESVHKSQLAVSQRHSGSQAKMHTALESLERIKQKQAER